MACCNTFAATYCVSYCSALDLGYDAVQTGTHKVLYTINGGNSKEIDLGSLMATDDLVIPEQSLNESKAHDVRILQPDGTYYEFTAGVTCVRINTEVRV